MRKSLPTPVCTCCDRIARDIPAVHVAASYFNATPEDYVIQYDGSYDSETGEFICDGCYAMQRETSELVPYF